MRTALFLALLLAGCAASPVPTPSPSPTPSPTPVPLVALGSFFGLEWNGASPEWLSAALDAGRIWNESTGWPVFTWEGGATLIKLGGAHGTLYINGANFDGYAFPRGVAPAVLVDLDTRPDRRRALLIHELGHIIGLGHSDDPADAMHNPVADGATPSPHDIERARAALLGG